MRPLSLELRPSILNAAMVSIILHLSIINLFTFTLTSKTQECQPLFLFLGAILQKQDFEEMASGYPRTSLTSEETILIPQNSHPAALSSAGVNKPAGMSGNAPKNQKQYIKTQFEESAEVPSESKTPKAKTADENAAPYVPLRSIFQ